MLTRKDRETGKRRIVGRKNPSDTETTEYGKMVRRMMRAWGRRVANADEVDLAQMLAARDEFDRAIALAVYGQRKLGHSWAYIAAGAGITRQAAEQRWGKACRQLAAEESERERVAAYCLDCRAEAKRPRPDAPFVMHRGDDCPNRKLAESNA